VTSPDLQLNSRANVMIGRCPSAARFRLCFAEGWCTIHTTPRLTWTGARDAGLHRRLCPLVFDLTSIMLLLRQGAFMMRVGVAVLILSVTLSCSRHSLRPGGSGGGSGPQSMSQYIVAPAPRCGAHRDSAPAACTTGGSLGLLILSATLAAAVRLEPSRAPFRPRAAARSPDLGERS